MDIYWEAPWDSGTRVTNLEVFENCANILTFLEEQK